MSMEHQCAYYFQKTKGVLDPLELEFQMVVSILVPGVLGIKPRSSRRAISTLNH